MGQMVQVITPSIFSPMQWCHCALSADESLIAVDIPEDVLHLLSLSEKAMLCQGGCIIPMKSALCIIHGVLNVGGHEGHNGAQEVTHHSMQGGTLVAETFHMQPVREGRWERKSR